MDLPNYDNARQWRSWFRARSALFRYGVMIAVGALLYHFLLATPWIVSLRSKVPATNIPSISSKIAGFQNEWPRTNMGTELQVLTDSKFRGRSTISYQLETHPKSNYFLRINYRLDRGSNSLIGDAYSGIYFEWTEPPARTIDASAFEGFKFKVSYGGIENTKKPRFIVNVATLETPNYEYHEFDFSSLLDRPNVFYSVEVPFSLLQVPNWASPTGRSRLFDASTVFRVSIVMKGINESGHLDMDDLAFIRKRLP